MKNNFFVILFTALIVLSCSRDQFTVDPDNKLIGTWVLSGYDGDMAVYHKEDKFTDTNCYRFNPDGTLTEHKNSGWCGTPPVTYADYPGTWSVLNDTLVSIDVGYWGGKMKYKLDIQYISPTTLKTVSLWEQ